MEKEYDFSKGTRGKFYHNDADFHLPIYLDSKIENFIMNLAKEKKMGMSEIVNSLLFKDKELIELMSATR